MMGIPDLIERYVLIEDKSPLASAACLPTATKACGIVESCDSGSARQRCTRCDLNGSRSGIDMCEHPFMQRVPLCQSCASTVKGLLSSCRARGFQLDDLCCWCADGGNLLLCTGCEYAFCQDCVIKHFGAEKLNEVLNDDNWNCFRCNTDPLKEIHKTFDSFARSSRNQVGLSAEQKQALKTQNKAVRAAIAALRETLSLNKMPKGTLSLRAELLNVRKIVNSIKQYGNASARLSLLGDVLVLWAHTSNFSTVTEYVEIKSDRIGVVARELGVSVTRSSLSGGSSCVASGPIASECGVGVGVGSDSVRSAEVPSSATLCAVNDKIESTSSVCDAVGNAAEADVKASVPVSDIEGSTMDVDVGPSLAPPPVEAAQLSDSDSSYPGFQCIVSVSTSDETNFVEPPDETVKAVRSSIRMQSRPSVSSDCTSNHTDTHTHGGSTQDQSSACVSRCVSRCGASDELVPPAEVVFTGEKIYDKNFVFWQLMGWYNAGTDSKEAPPDMFGCVQLPPPSACFGKSVCEYGAKQRRALRLLLQNEKEQVQPWPASLRDCFNCYNGVATAADPGQAAYALTKSTAGITDGEESDGVETGVTSSSASPSPVSISPSEVKWDRTEQSRAEQNRTEIVRAGRVECYALLGNELHSQTL